jgi:putative solute:sodium symporter small subunit
MDSMIDHQRQVQWRANTRLTFLALALVGVFFVVLPLLAPLLADSYVLRFPLGYLLASVGSVVGLAALIFWVAGRQDRLDARYNISGDY